MKTLRLYLQALFTLFLAADLTAGTLFFKDGKKISEIKIISIADGQIIVEKDKARKSFPTSKIKAYYDADIKAGEEGTPEDYGDYKVTIFDIKVPKRGRNAKKKTEYAEIEYSLTRKGTKGKKFKVPYFYLYILTPGKDDYSDRDIYCYYSPSQAKPKSKGYDAAAILERVLDFGRPEWNLDHIKDRSKLTNKKVKFSLRGVYDRKVLAWHLEVWGNKDKIYEKSGTEYPDEGIGKNWWKRLKK